MTDLAPLRAAEGVQALIDAIRRELERHSREIRIMEVCGTHTMTAYRSGLGSRLRRMGLRLISGPGCPVCVTPDSVIATAAWLLTTHSDLILASFGDMLRVPTEGGPLMSLVPAERSEVRVIYSAEDLLAIAAGNPGCEVVFLAAGFETTIPSIAWTAAVCRRERLSNVSFLPAMKLVPPALKAMIEGGDSNVDGFIYPGHVTVIIGTDPYRFIAERHRIPGAVAGFEPIDLLLGILSVLAQIREERAEVDVVYRRAVRPEGNPVARDWMREVLREGETEWRGFGTIPSSGLFPPEDLSSLARFGAGPDRGWEAEGCRCGEVVRGAIEPESCPLFGSSCTPGKPLGPCMVSYEGTCLIHYKYGREVEA